MLLKREVNVSFEVAYMDRYTQLPRDELRKAMDEMKRTMRLVDKRIVAVDDAIRCTHLGDGNQMRIILPKLSTTCLDSGNEALALAAMQITHGRSKHQNVTRAIAGSSILSQHQSNGLITHIR